MYVNSYGPFNCFMQKHWIDHLGRLVEKNNNVVSEQDRHKSGCKPEKTAISLKFRIYEEGFYFPSSENKGADQLRGYREADLRLCFRLSNFLVFS